METLRSLIDGVRAASTGVGISNGITLTTTTVKGVQGPVNLTVNIKNVSGFPNLRQVDASATWTESFNSGTRSDSMYFSTWVKPNET